MTPIKYSVKISLSKVREETHRDKKTQPKNNAMKTKTIKLNGRSYDALIITPDNYKRMRMLIILMGGEFIRLNEVRKNTYEVTAQGKEPYTIIQNFLSETCDWELATDPMPSDTGYDTDADGRGYGSIFVCVKSTKLDNDKYMLIYETGHNYILTDDGTTYREHGAIVGSDPLKLAKAAEKVEDFYRAAMWKNGIQIYQVVQKCDEETNSFTDELEVSEILPDDGDLNEEMRKMFYSLEMRGLAKIENVK